jgi:hypothetical protein
MDSIILEKKELIEKWLIEHNLAPEEVTTQNSYFLYKFRITGILQYVIQDMNHSDKVHSYIKSKIPKEDQQLLKGIANPKRSQLFWDIRLALLENPYVLDFKLFPNPPENFEGAYVSSYFIYYENLTRDVLIKSIYEVRKAFAGIQWRIRRTAGGTKPPSENPLGSGSLPPAIQ